MHTRHGVALRLATFVASFWAAIATSADAPRADFRPLDSVAVAPVGRFVDRTYQDESGSHRYMIYLPPGYSSDRRWPVVLFLHGAGERGSDGVSPCDVGLGPVLRHSPELYPCVVVFPQCETWDAPIFSSWSPESPSGRRALAILNEVERTESIDIARRSLTGWSMGGYGVTAIASHNPEHWQSALAIAGGFEGTTSAPLQSLPLWIIHGAQDTIVSVEKSRDLAKSLGLPVAHSRYDEVQRAGHEVWESVYSEPRVAQWLLSGGPIPEVDWTAPVDPARLPTADDGAPFVTAASVSHAVSLRIGNDALRMISAGIPESVKTDRLQGTLPDIRESLTVDGETYQLSLTQLTYTAKLASVELSAQATAEIRADLGLRLELRIGSASLRAQRFEASTAPFRIVIGHRRPVPLSVLIQPRVRDQKLTLLLRDTAFPIPDDNWYVEKPSDIRITGSKFTRHEIETGIVGGLYTRKTEVEEQVRSVIPRLIERVEQRLVIEDSSQFTRWLWPFPVYQPRLRWTAEALAVDGHGMTIELGAHLGASHPRSVREPMLHRTGMAKLPIECRTSTDLHVTMDTLLMEVVSEEFASSGSARINVLDLPQSKLQEPCFHMFAQPDRMRKVLPGLAPGAEIQAVLALSGPFQWRGKSPPQGRGGLAQLTIPQAQLEVFSRLREETPWSAAGRFSIALDQQIEISCESPPIGPPRIGLYWSDDPDLTVTSLTTIEEQAIKDLEHDVRTAWVGWSQTRNVAPAAAEDFVLGDSRMRLDSLALGPRSIDVHLKAPMAQLTVTGSSPLLYRVRGWNTNWSRTRTLEPGQTHRYEVHDPLEWQILSVRGETYTLQPGEVARWDEQQGISYEPPRPTGAPVTTLMGDR